jgi:hypothetical protein
MDKQDLLQKIYLMLIKAETAEEILDEEAQPVEPKTQLQKKILEGVDHFEKEAERILGEEQKIQNFLKGYQRLALLSKSYTDQEVLDLYHNAQEINIIKSFEVPEISYDDRLDKVIYIDAIAHNLHQFKREDGSAIYKQLDDLADISKSAGEEIREDRLLILNKPSSIEALAKMNNLEIIQKGTLLDRGKSFWRLFEKALKHGVEPLTDTELIVLREWLYSKV